MLEEELEKAAKRYTAKTGAGAMALIPKFRWIRGEVVEFFWSAKMGLKWQQKFRIEWDADVMEELSALWEILLEIDRFNYHAGERDGGAIALVLYLAKASERVCLPVGRGRRISIFPGRFCGCYAGTP